jgi:hypothetical protein
MLINETDAIVYRENVYYMCVKSVIYIETLFKYGARSSLAG